MIQKDIALFISYVLTCARGLVYEPILYGPSRYLSVMILLRDLLINQFNYKNEHIERMVEGIEEIRLLCMTDVDGFISAIDYKIHETGGVLVETKDDDQHIVYKFFYTMIVNARKLVDETSMYGPWRLLDTLSEFYHLIIEQFGFKDEVLTNMIMDIKSFNHLALNNSEEFVERLDNTILLMVHLVDNNY